MNIVMTNLSVCYTLILYLNERTYRRFFLPSGMDMSLVVLKPVKVTKFQGELPQRGVK